MQLHCSTSVTSSEVPVGGWGGGGELEGGDLLVRFCLLIRFCCCNMLFSNIFTRSAFFLFFFLFW